MDRRKSEAIALEALGWLAADPDLVGAFLAEAGTGPEALRARAREPEFLGFVLDFLLAEDARVIAFCGAAGLPFDALMRARGALPGGESVHWT